MLSAQAISAVSAAFLGSLVEVVEAFTLILAASLVRGWRPALLGAGAGALLVAALVAAFWPLLERFPLRPMQGVIGVLLLLFGMRWLHKAILRGRGLIPLHDEDIAFAQASRDVGQSAKARPERADWLAGLAAFKAVLLEGMEVVFIVIAVGAGRGLTGAASLGALLAALLVAAIGALAHRPLTRVPENSLKFCVGAMLSAFGVFWTAEALGGAWPGGDLMLPALILGFALVGLALLRLPPPVASPMLRS